ncbi:MAG: PH domain-containing protein [Propioniciclava sp.]
MRAHPRMLRRQAIIWSLLLPGAALLGWFALPMSTRMQFTGLQVATLAFFVLIMLSIVWILAVGYVRADADGVQFRNGFKTHALQWSEIESIRFRAGDHWPFVELGESDVPMIGIQRSDGHHAEQDVAALRTLWAAGRRPRQDPELG